MFKDAGKELKLYAQTFGRLIIAIVALFSILIAVCGFTLLSEELSFGWWLVVVAIITFIIGYFIARLSVIRLYAFGEIAQRILAIDIRQGGLPNRGPIPESIEQPEPLKSDAPITMRNEDGSWNCVFCDHKNPKDAKKCQSCGVLAEF